MVSKVTIFPSHSGKKPLVCEIISLSDLSEYLNLVHQLITKAQHHRATDASWSSMHMHTKTS